MPVKQVDAVKDFFISYTSADRHWAEWIAWQLEANDYSVEFQAWDFSSGDDFIARMNRVLKESERTLAVLTPKYFESRFTEAEWSAAFAEDKLLPVRVVDFDVKGLLSSRAYIDLAGKKEERRKRLCWRALKQDAANQSRGLLFRRQL
jgi:TIR domain-containing protein